jgi:hypothetical protein
MACTDKFESNRLSARMSALPSKQRTSVGRKGMFKKVPADDIACFDTKKAAN